MWGSARFLAILVAVFLVPARGESQTCAAYWEKYLTHPSWPATNHLPYSRYVSGVLFTDIDDDSHEDLLVTSGNDMMPELAEVYFNDGSGIPGAPPSRGWFPRRDRYNGKAAVGDIDKDGCNELLVAVFFDRAGRRMNGGNIRIYDAKRSGNECRLSRNSAKLDKLPKRFTAGSVALADVDGDAWLDVIVPLATRNTGRFPPDPTTVQAGTFSRIYLNDGAGQFGNSGWKPDQKMRAGDAEFADLDGDGYGDLVFASRQSPTVFWGKAPEDDDDFTGIGKAGCRQQLGANHFRDLSYAVDVSRIDFGGGSQSYIAHVSADPATASTNYAPHYHAFEIFSADKANCTVTSRWSSGTDLGRPSAVRFGNLLGNDKIFLLAGRWSDKNEAPDAGSQLRVYKQKTSGIPDFDLKACLAPAEPVINEIALADLDDSGASDRTYTVSSPLAKPLVTLDRHLVEVITRVEYDDNGTWVVLTGDDYAWVPGENWVSFGPSAMGKTVRVHYRTSNHWDIGYGDFDPNRWPGIHYRR